MGITEQLVIENEYGEMYMKKGIKRCPKCQTSSIYRRSRALFWSSNGKGKCPNMSIGRDKERNKCYKCQKCKHEFDKPLVL